MDNPAIITSALAAPTMAPPVKQTESQPETSFNQVLQREITDRGNTDNQDVAKPQETSNTATAQPTSDKPVQKADAKEKNQ